jgi:hypothetical protein
MLVSMMVSESRKESALAGELKHQRETKEVLRPIEQANANRDKPQSTQGTPLRARRGEPTPDLSRQELATLWPRSVDKKIRACARTRYSSQLLGSLDIEIGGSWNS